jgi:pantoate--beta-alanine ligase
MVEDLGLGLEIRVVPTVRDDDGLALSSRNQLLEPEERQAAKAIPGALAKGAEAYRAGRDPAAEATVALQNEPRVKPQYVQVARFDGRLVLAAAARVGPVRLIDNVILEGGPE